MFIPGPVIDCWACEGTGIGRKFVERVRVPTGEVCSWCTNDGSSPEYDGDDGSYYRQKYVEPGKTRDRWWSDRSYRVFAILGNVRNGHGFAGVETHEPLPYISDCRGVPDDATPETLDVLSNEHSASWCTMEELMAYDWKQPIHQVGVVSIQAYASLRGTGAAPEHWSGGISGPNIVTLMPLAADVILATHPLELTTGAPEPHPLRDDAVPIDGIRYYVQYRWTDDLESYTGNFMERMRMLAGHVGERETRLIFDFDS